MPSSLPRRLDSRALGTPSLPFSLLLNPLPPSALLQAHKHLFRIYHSLLLPELDLLEKIRYKQKNQHSQATWWRHLSAVQRFGSRVREECDRELVSLWSATAYDDVQQRDLARYGLATLRIMLLAEKSGPAFIKAMAALEQLLRAALFMPLALALKALVSRLFSSLRVLQVELKNWLIVVQSLLKKSTAVSEKDDARRSGKSALRRWEDAMASLPSELKGIYESATRKAAKTFKQDGSARDGGTSTSAGMESLGKTRVPAASRQASSQLSTREATPLLPPSSSRGSPAPISSHPANDKKGAQGIASNTTPVASIQSDSLPDKPPLHAKRKMPPCGDAIITPASETAISSKPGQVKGQEKHPISAGDVGKGIPLRKKKVKRTKGKQDDDIDAIFGGL